MRIANPAAIILAPENLQKFMWGALKARRTDIQQPMLYWRGRGVGGSSAVNGQIAIRGMLDDFDIWAREGCEGWSGAEVLPYFIKLEDDLDFGGEPYHGRGGPIPVMRTPQEEWGGIDKALRDACLGLSYGWCADHNAPEGTGVSPYAMNRRNNARVSTNDAYLEPARGRGNLRIIGDALVDSVEFDGSTGGGDSGAHARRMASHRGRGNHFIRGRDSFARDPDALGRRPRRGSSRPGHSQCCRSAGRTRSHRPSDDRDEHGAQAGGALPRISSRATPIARCDTARGSAARARTTCSSLAMNLLGYSEQTLGYGFIWMTAYQTWSRGVLRITSRSPEIDPELRFRMLSDERDLMRMRDGLRRLQEIAKQPAITSIADRISFGNPLLITQGVSEVPPDGRGAGSVDDGELLRLAARRGNVPDGTGLESTLGGGSRMPRHRNRRPARDRLLGDAGNRARQHASEHGDDRGEDGRSHSRRGRPNLNQSYLLEIFSDAMKDCI